MDKSFVTEGRLVLARNLAAEFAEKEPWASPGSCADKAVRRVFGRWLEEPSAAIRPRLLPLYFQLVSRVERDLGLHRRTGRRLVPSWPAALQVRQRTAGLAV